MSGEDPKVRLEAMIEDWNRERPDVEMAPLRIFLPLRQALQSAERRRKRILAEHGVTPAILDLLVALRRLGPPYTGTPSELARSLVLSAGGVSQRLDRIEQAGLIKRSVNIDDRRVVYVALTHAGLELLDRLIGEYMEHEDQLLESLTARQRTSLSDLLLRLIDSIESTGEMP